MERQAQASADLARLGELIGDIKVAMLATVESDGSLRSRPLVTLQMDGSGALWFFTSISSPKIGEIDAHRRVNLSYAHPGRRDYASVSGVTQIIRDPDKARELWTPTLLAWFPDGVDDPDLVLLKVTIEEAEYWDLPSGGTLRFFGSTAGAEHQKIDIRS